MLKVLSSHCSGVSLPLELGRSPEGDGLSRFRGVTDRAFEFVMLILGASPFDCFIPNCEKGFCCDADVFDEDDTLAASWPVEIADGCEAAMLTLFSSLVGLGCVGA